MPVSPVFVLGAPRSGTSIMNQVLREALGYAGENEGHVFSVLKRIQDILDRQQEFILKAFPPRPVTTFQKLTYDRITGDVTELFKGYVRELYGDRPWQDKTPTHEMIPFAPRLQEIFPSVRFIFMKRRGIENILSGQRKFQHRSFLELCQSWSKSMESFSQVRGSLRHVLVIDQSDLITDVERVSRELGQFLELDPNAEAACLRHLKENFPERTHVARATYVDFDDTNWSDEEKAQFHDICGKQMDKWGYPLHTSSLRETKNLNRWCEIPKDPFEAPITIHPNLPDQPAPEVRFLAINFGGIRRLKLEAVSNSKGPGAVLDATIVGEDDLRANSSVALAPGKRTALMLDLPESAGVGDLLISAKLPENCESNHCTGISISPIKMIGYNAKVRARQPVE